VPPTFDTRVGAYGLIVRENRVLLAHWNLLPNEAGWTLPGGGLEQGEDPATAAVREVYEETGFTVRLDELLGLDSLHYGAHEGADPGPRPRHSLRVIYRATIIAGDLRVEVGGSTDDTRWFDLDEVTGLRRVSLVDTAIGMWRRSHGGRSAGDADRYRVGG
jgi:ADP-ribose pyrophosphatase YjhB (NUDIX family)